MSDLSTVKGLDQLEAHADRSLKRLEGDYDFSGLDEYVDSLPKNAVALPGTDYEPRDEYEARWKETIGSDSYNRWRALNENFRASEEFELTEDDSQFIDEYVQKHHEWLDENVRPSDTKLWLQRRAWDVSRAAMGVPQAAVVDPVMGLYSTVAAQAGLDPRQVDLMTEIPALVEYFGGFDSQAAYVQAIKNFDEHESGIISKAADMVGWVAGTFGTGGLAFGGKLSGKLISKAGEQAVKSVAKRTSSKLAQRAAQIGGQAAGFGALQGIIRNTDENGKPLPGREKIVHGLTEAALFPAFAIAGMMRHSIVGAAKGKGVTKEMASLAAGAFAEGVGLTALDGEFWSDAALALHKGDEAALERAVEKVFTNTLAIAALSSPAGIRGVRETYKRNSPTDPLLPQRMEEAADPSRIPYQDPQPRRASESGEPLEPQTPLDRFSEKHGGGPRTASEPGKPLKTTEEMAVEGPPSREAVRPDPGIEGPVGAKVYSDPWLRHLGFTDHQVRARMSGQTKADPKADVYGKLQENVDARHLFTGLGEGSIEVGPEGSRVVVRKDGKPSLIYRWVNGRPQVAEAAKPDAEREWKPIMPEELAFRRDASKEQIGLVQQHLPMVRDAIMGMRGRESNPDLTLPEQRLMSSVFSMLQNVHRSRDSGVEAAMQLLETGVFAEALGRDPRAAIENLALAASGAVTVERAAAEMGAFQQQGVRDGTVPEAREAERRDESTPEGRRGREEDAAGHDLGQGPRGQPREGAGEQGPRPEGSAERRPAEGARRPSQEVIEAARAVPEEAGPYRAVAGKRAVPIREAYEQWRERGNEGSLEEFQKRLKEMAESGEVELSFYNARPSLSKEQLARIDEGRIEVPGSQTGLDMVRVDEARERESEAGRVDISALAETSGIGRRIVEGLEKFATSMRRNLIGRAISQFRDYASSFGPQGKRLAREVEDVEMNTALRASPELAKAEAIWENLPKPKREIIGKLLDGLSPKGATPELRAKAEELRQILDAPQHEAIERGLRKHELKGTAMPTQIKPEYREEFAEMIRKKRGSEESKEEIISDVEASDVEVLDPATGRSVRLARAAKRRREGYVEGARTEEIPEHMREWDVADVIPDKLFDVYRTLEATKLWGNDFNLLDQRIGELREGGASAFERNLIDNYLRMGFGALPRHNRMPFVQGFSKFQTATKLTHPFSWLQNNLQPYLTSVTEPGASVGSMLRKLPPGMVELPMAMNAIARYFTGKEIPSGKKWRDAVKDLVAQGVVPGKRGMGEHHDKVVGQIGDVMDMSMKPFTSVEMLNQARAALMGRASLEADMGRLVKYHQTQKKAGKPGNRVVEKMEKMAAWRRVKKRMRISNEELADKVSRGGELTAREIQEVMYRIATDTQFVMNMATQPIYWHNPAFRLFMKFKPFTLGMMRWVSRDVAGEALHGNVQPLMRFLGASILFNELVNFGKDLVRGDQQSLLAQAEKGVELEGDDITFGILRDVAEGGGLPLIDFTYGFSNWLLGPAGSTAVNVSKTIQDAMLNTISIRDVAETIAGESTLLKDVGRFLSVPDHYDQYLAARNMAFEVRGRIEGDKQGPLSRVRKGIADTFAHRGIQRSENSLDYDIVANRVARGWTDDAADWIVEKLQSARDDAHLGKMIEGFARQISSRAPLSPLTAEERAEAPERMGEEFYRMAEEADARFRETYAEALQTALRRLDI